MISQLMSNPTFSNAVNQSNNRSTNASAVNAKNEDINDKKTQENSKTTASKLDSIKDAIKNGTYQISGGKNLTHHPPQHARPPVWKVRKYRYRPRTVQPK